MKIGVGKMDLTKSELIKKGWISIGADGVLEYFAKENEHGEILYIPVHEEKTVGNVRSMRKEVVTLLSTFVSK